METNEENKLEEMFEYIGKQETKKEHIELYICRSCESAIAYQSILDVNPNLKKSLQ